MKLSTTRLDAALKDLLKRIDHGQEFPDACFASACKFLVPYSALVDAYDNHCSHN